jgi:hypothetical protein
MTAKFIDTHHVLMFDDTQVDVIYNFHFRQLEIYMDGCLYFSGIFNPARHVLSYSNVLDVASYYYSRYLKSKS